MTNSTQNKLIRIFVPILMMMLLFSASVYAYTVTYTYDGAGQVKQALYENKAIASYTYDRLEEFECSHLK